MKNKKIISLAALALTASLFLGACGGNKEEKTSEASSSKTSQVKQTSSSSKKKLGPVKHLHQLKKQHQ